MSIPHNGTKCVNIVGEGIPTINVSRLESDEVPSEPIDTQ